MDMYPVPNYYYEEDEKEIVRPGVGDVLRFSQEHDLERHSLNKTFTNVIFKPDNAFNNLHIQNVIEARLAPFLTHDMIYKNVIAKPMIVPTTTSWQRDAIGVQMGAYGRFWFGWMHDVTHANVPGHVGLTALENGLAMVLWCHPHLAFFHAKCQLND